MNDLGILQIKANFIDFSPIEQTGSRFYWPDIVQNDFKNFFSTDQTQKPIQIHFYSMKHTHVHFEGTLNPHDISKYIHFVNTLLT